MKSSEKHSVSDFKALSESTMNETKMNFYLEKTYTTCFQPSFLSCSIDTQKFKQQSHNDKNSDSKEICDNISELFHNESNLNLKQNKTEKKKKKEKQYPNQLFKSIIKTGKKILSKVAKVSQPKNEK